MKQLLTTHDTRMLCMWACFLPCKAAVSPSYSRLTCNCKKVSGNLNAYIQNRQWPWFLTVFRADQLPGCISAGGPLTATHIGPLCKTCRANDGPLLGCWLRFPNTKVSASKKKSNHILRSFGLQREKTCPVVCEQQRRRPAFASAQSDQRLCYSLFEKYHI